MSTLSEQLAQLRRFNAAVHAGDPELATESGDLGGLEVREGAPSEAGFEQAIEFESIAMRRNRPVLAIRDNTAQLVFIENEDSEIWRGRLQRAKPLLDRAIRAVGRIELEGSPLGWVGTGWLVADNVLVTNRHVASEFASRRSDGFTFRVGDDGPMRAAVDFLQELDRPETLVFKLIKPLHIEESPGPDVSFFEIEVVAGDAKLATRIELATQLATTENVATIGYPAYDSRIPEPDLMERIYGKVYNKKRLAPGGVTRIEERRILHNCTTLGGNSGSVVLNLDSGQALGLHFSGSFLRSNYAVRSDIVRTLLNRVRAGGTRPEAVRPRVPQPHVTGAPAGAGTRPESGTIARVTIPLTVTVSLGTVAHTPMPQRYRGPAVPAADDNGDLAGDEAVAEDYRDRRGYQPDFLGIDVDLPSVERDAADVLAIESDGRSEKELRYEHFSVVMSRSRRMCFLSAVNINGGLSRKTKRVPWKWDPRLPKAQQIMNECYGNPPKFSRGHMTRREDPAWGDTVGASRGNADSMHVTNVTPQMQAFNSPIWLALEDHALSHAREDDMKISVFTGPYFSDDDPLMHGVRIPLTFWKIIAFIHDETGKLCATGYEMNQEQSLQADEEFVFGAFNSPQLGTATQVSIGLIETRSGIFFGGLAGFDPLSSDSESVVASGATMLLQTFDQIRYLS